MPLSIDIIEVISNIVINIISNDLDSIKGNFILFFKIKVHNKKTKKWIREFINENDETFLTTSTFERYLKYRKPIEKIHDYVFELDDDNIDKDTFISECVRECKEYFTTNQKSLIPRDERLLKDFYNKVLDNFISFSNKQLSISDKRIIQETKRSNQQIKDKLEGGMSTLADIKKLLKDKQEITNPDVLHSIYNYIDKEIWNGEFEKVSDFLPLIEGNSNDLENAIKIKLHLLSTYKCLRQDIITTFSSIDDLHLHNDVARLLILHYFDDIDTLSKIKLCVRDDNLSSIIECIINKNSDKFFKAEIKQKNNANIYEFKLGEDFKDEQWLVKRICLLLLYEKVIINAYALVESLVDEDKTYIDELILIQKETEDVLLTFADSEKTNQDRLTEISDVLLQKQHKYEKCNEKVQVLYYDTLIKALTLADNEKLIYIHHNIPKTIQKNPKIEAITIYVKSLNNEIKDSDLIDFCLKNESYWILNRYLSKISFDNPKKFIEIIDKQPVVLEKHAVFFFMYYNVIKEYKGVKKAKELLIKYEKHYADNLKYWIELYEISTENKSDLIDTAYEKWENIEFSYLNLYTEIDFIDILVFEQKYEQALSVVNKLETIGWSSPELLKRKANILNHLNRLLDSFQILLNIFEYYNNDIFVVGNILSIAVNYKRDVPKVVIDSATKMESSQILMLVAVICEREYKNEEALQIATKSLLLAKNESEPIYGYYFGLLARIKPSSLEQVSDANDDTAVVLQNEDSQKIYCIHKNNILPKEQYACHNAIHINRDTAIQIGLLRKKLNSKIFINKIEYIITEIMPLDCYLSRICLINLIDNGGVKALSMQSDSNDKVDIDELTAQVKNYVTSNESLDSWLSQSNDMTKLPLTLFTLSKSTKLSYQEFVFAFLQKKSFYIREILPHEFSKKEQYILSFSGLAILYKLDVPIGTLLEKDVIISTSTLRETIYTDKKIIEKNNNDDVASIGIVNDKLYFHTATEEEKSYYMQESTKFKKYTKNIRTEENTNDICIPKLKNLDLIELLGICDYDSISIAKNNHRILVHPEPIISCLSNSDEYKFSTIRIVDFLTELEITISDMFEYMNKLVDFRFLITLTEKSFNYIVKKYDEIADDDKKENLLENWIDYLSSIQKIDDDYKVHFSNNLTEVLRKVYKSPSDIQHPIYHYLFVYYMKYNNLKLRFDKDSSGNLDVKLISTDNTN